MLTNPPHRAADLDYLKLALHPYLYWTEPGSETGGRTKVLAYLAHHPNAEPPSSHELRDGQIYRWTIGPVQQC